MIKIVIGQVGARVDHSGCHIEGVFVPDRILAVFSYKVKLHVTVEDDVLRLVQRFVLVVDTATGCVDNAGLNRDFAEIYFEAVLLLRQVWDYDEWRVDLNRYGRALLRLLEIECRVVYDFVAK